MSLILDGNKAKASLWIPFAKRQLRILKEYMKRHGLDILSKTLPLVAAGITIFVSSSFGQDRIMITAAGTQGTIWISDGYPPCGYSGVGCGKFIPISHWDTQGNYLGNMTNPDNIGNGLFAMGTTGIAEANGNLFFASAQAGACGVGSEEPSTLLREITNPQFRVEDMAIGKDKIYAIEFGWPIDPGDLILWDLNISGLGQHITTASDPALYAANRATAVDFYKGVLYVAWEFPIVIGMVNTFGSGVAIHDPETGAFKSWVVYSEEIGTLNDIFVFRGVLYGTDTTNKQLITYDFKSEKIWLYKIAQYLPAVYGSDYYPLSIVVNSEGVFFTAYPAINQGWESGPMGPAKFVKLDNGFNLVFAVGKQVPHHSNGSPDWSNPALYTGDVMIAPYLMLLQGRT